MAYFYVDYENVHSDGLAGIDTLSKSDRVFIYCRQDDVPRIRTYFSFTKTKATVSCRIVEATTKNALDFELISEMFSEHRKGRINYIVSGDKGFDAAIQKGMHRGILCFRKEFVGDIRFELNIAILGEKQEDIRIITSR